MIKPPARPPRIFIGFVDEEGTDFEEPMWTDESIWDNDTEYIRRDLIQTILIRVHLHEARRDDIKLDQIIDEVIQHHENKNKNTK